MFKRPVAIIVGAGAGVEYDMPLGLRLATDIASNVRFRFEHHTYRPTSGDATLFEILFRRFQHDRDSLNAFTLAGNELADAISSAVSIDDALYQLSENHIAVTLGKLAIFRAILTSEKNGKLKVSRETARLDSTSGKDGWIEQIFSIAIANLKKSELHTAFNNVTFINFNYDRCIEHYLYWSFQRIGITDADAAQIVSSLNMIRPYGGLGSCLAGTKGGIPFGYSDRLDVFDMVDRIRTYTEASIHDSTQLEQGIHNAHLILVLGFGFHPQNLNLLALDSPRRGHVMATVKKVHPEVREDLREALRQTLSTDSAFIELFDMTAPEMLRDLRLKIMMRASR